jgi:hypothetical protein
MKRIGYILLISVAMLTALTLALAQLESKGAKYLLRVLTGEEVRGYYGSAVEGGYAWTGKTPLFAVSASGELNGPMRVGKVYFFDGLMAEQPILKISSPAEGDLFGRTLSGGGDWNGDGVPDLAIGAPYAQDPKEKSLGKVYLYLGGSEFGKGTPLSVSSTEAQDGFGEAILLKHDVNGDGLADLIVGAPRSAKAGATSGRAYVWFGRIEGIPSRADVEIKLGTTNDLFGTSVAAGDVNGDGQADVIIGSPCHNLADKTPGSVFIFHGGKSIDFTKPSQALSGEGTGFQDLFGQSVAVVDDQNGDKIPELLVGAPQVTIEKTQCGKAYLYSGAATLSTNPTKVFSGKTAASKFGQNVLSLHELNNDGKGDFAIQAEGEAGSKGILYVFYGGWDKEFYQFIGESVGDRAGGSVAAIGDLDGNKSPDVLVGARWNDAASENGGRAYVLSFN